MKFRFIAAMILAAAGFVIVPSTAQAEAPTKTATLKNFRSDADLRRYLKRIANAHRPPQQLKGLTGGLPPIPPPPPPPVPVAMAAPPAVNAIVTQSKVATPATAGITNNQVAGVDEGDIVKASGDLVIVLRRGRLFTLSIAGGGLKPVDTIDASAPGVDPRGDWYDEMLIADGRIVVIGYSYAREGTQVNRFRVTKDGKLSFEDAYALKSDDYYSSRNYASRLIGTKLIFYSPRYLYWETNDFRSVFPGLKRLDGTAHAFKPIGTAQDIFVAPGQDLETVSAVHTVTACDLMAPVLSCSATSVLGPDGRVFYVSSNAVYVWVTAWRWEEKKSRSFLYRLPLDGSRPQSVRVHGSPVDQFSFNDTADGLKVLVRADGRGDAMWAAERRGGEIALVTIAPAAFGDGTREVSHSAYRALPKPRGAHWAFHNRFVGDHLLYGLGNGWGAPKDATGTLYVVPVASGAVRQLAVPHGIDRIEAMGGDAVVIGSDGKNVVFSSVGLKQAPALGDRYVLAGASQGETRSHGFFFKPEGDANDGILGLPVMRNADPAYHQLFRESAAVVFVRRSDGMFTLLGDLPSHPAEARDDGCKASCVDWYGNSRPIFFAGRTFALMGYELVEGATGPRDLREVQRVNFNPGTEKVVRD